MLKRLVVSLAAAAALGASADAAVLTMQQMTATNNFGTIAPNPATVGAGPEFTVSVAGTPWFSIDFTEDGFVTVSWLRAGTVAHGATHLLSFTDTNGTIADIIGIDLISATGVTGIVQGDLNFNLNTVFFDIGNTNWTLGSSFTAQVQFATVPLPGALPLFLAGLGAVGWARRRAARA